jgi:hypothetical protein
VRRVGEEGVGRTTWGGAVQKRGKRKEKEKGKRKKNKEKEKGKKRRRRKSGKILGKTRKN